MTEFLTFDSLSNGIVIGIVTGIVIEIVTGIVIFCVFKNYQPENAITVVPPYCAPLLLSK